MAGSGYDGAIFGFGQSKNVATVEPGAELLPVRAGIDGAEDAAELLVVDHAGIEDGGGAIVAVVDEQGRDFALGDALI